MHYSSILAIAALFVSANAVVLTNTAQDFVDVETGKPFTITWAQANGPVTILLKSGPSTDLKTVSTITSGQTGTSYEWTPPSNLPEDKYAFEITDSGAPNYSVQFPISGGTAPAPSESSRTTSAPYTSSTGSVSAPYVGSTHYTSGSGNATSTAYNSGSPSAYPTGPSNSTTSSIHTSTLSTTKPSATSLPPDTSFATTMVSPFGLVLLSFASCALFL